jgi:autotransporter-associated beta strand protein
MKIQTAILLPAIGLLLFSSNLRADSGTWLPNPGNSDWNNGANWTSGTPPSDVATFDVSSQTSVVITAYTGVDSIVFDPGANSFTITSSVSDAFNFDGDGITNNSGVVQNFVAATNDAGSGGGFVFYDGTVGPNVVFTTYARTADTGNNGYVAFEFASAGSGTFHNLGASTASGAGGRTDFFYGSTAANSTIINEGGTGPGAPGGATAFLLHSATAGDATLIANGGTDGGEGGLFSFTGTGEGARARVELHGNGSLDISGKSAEGLTIGSLSGDGVVFLGSRNLSIGSNNSSTSFAGLLQDGGVVGGSDGSVTKVGSGTLVLSGVNSYTGGTVVEEGTLQVKTGKGSGTGPGSVQVNAGTFGGRSNIAGAVRIGSGTGTGAYLAPGIKGAGVLVIRNSLTFKADASYNCDLSLTQAKADEVIAKGVTIESGAQFALSAKGTQILPAGTVFTVIDNKSRQPISGSFANLPDNSTITANGNTLAVTYEGGDGNDLTLTVLR